MSHFDNLPEQLVLHRAANQAARAVIKVIEEHTGQEVSLYHCMRMVNVLGAALERNGLEGGPAGEIRAILEQPVKPAATIVTESAAPEAEPDDDDLYKQAVQVVKTTRRASTSMIQRRLRIGYNRALRLIELMEERGIVGPENGATPREVLIPD